MVRVAWEYKRVTIWGSEGTAMDEQASRALSAKYGEEGWDLVSAFYQVGEGYVFFFKRSKEG